MPHREQKKWPPQALEVMENDQTPQQEQNYYYLSANVPVRVRASRQTLNLPESHLQQCPECRLPYPRQNETSLLARNVVALQLEVGAHSHALMMTRKHQTPHRG